MNVFKNKLWLVWKDDEGIGTLEIIMIIAIIVIIAFAFRKWIVKWVNDLFKSTDSEINQYNNETPDILSSPSPTP